MCVAPEPASGCLTAPQNDSVQSENTSFRVNKNGKNRLLGDEEQRKI
jgi:hypothetical protein